MLTFGEWLVEVLSSRGIHASGDETAQLSEGISFETDDGVVVVSACEADDEVRVDLPVAMLDAASPDFGQTLLSLHELNAEARWFHDWVLTVDEDDVVVLSQVRTLDTFRPEDLDTLIVEGFSLATSLELALNAR